MRNEDDFLRAKGIPVDNKEEIFGTVEPVTEEKGDMIDFALVEDEKAKDHIDHEIETVVEASVALEAYTVILKQNPYDGISKQAAQAMRIGLARIDRVLDQRSELVVALEDEGSGDIKRIGNEKSGVSQDGLAGRAKELWKKFVELLKKGIAKAKAGMQKIQAAVGNGAKRIEKLREDFKNWSPNGPGGGKKITIPAKTATLGHPGGKHVDMNEILGVSTWMQAQMAPAILKGYAGLRALKGTESAEDIRAAAKVNIPAPPTIPASARIEVADGEIKFEIVLGEEVIVPVRSKSEINKALDLCTKVNDSCETNREVGDKLADASLDLIDMDWDIRFKGASDVINALQESIGQLRALAAQQREIMLYVLRTNLAEFDIMGLERGYKSAEEVEENSATYG